ncbi:endonuclease/exonuclease/phosphatase family protein [Photobacterium leiognathi]|uniref:endonuclease/exonuclease/phosphatase family protein n=2 Tax=Photobacterium leiognathi TaxID=553611 RepID=UPI000D16ECF3|nr:endonuclease/exonuclease/phosphatase family protein [Photobacterium leiognathi]PSW44358.1 hypothetical protein C0W40_09085 [Photobacterium leiognathi subsp. mandapamensis]
MKYLAIFVGAICAANANSFEIDIHNDTDNNTLIPYINQVPDSCYGGVKAHENQIYNGHTPCLKDFVKEGDIANVDIFNQSKNEFIQCESFNLDGERKLTINNHNGLYSCFLHPQHKNSNIDEIVHFVKESNNKVKNIYTDVPYYQDQKYFGTGEIYVDELNNILIPADTSIKLFNFYLKNQSPNTSASFRIKYDIKDLNNEKNYIYSGIRSLAIDENNVLWIEESNGLNSKAIYKNLKPGKWQHILISRTENKLKVYVDGEVVYKEHIDFELGGVSTLGRETETLDDGSKKIGNRGQFLIGDFRLFTGSLSNNQAKSISNFDLKKDPIFVPVFNPTPSDTIKNVKLNPDLSWLTHPAMQPSDAVYFVEISTDKKFKNIIYSNETYSNKVHVDKSLDGNKTYFWRVSYNDQMSDTFEFKTRLNDKNLKEKHKNSLTVMEFNVWGISSNGTMAAHRYGSHYIAEVIKNAGADIAVLTEGYFNAESVAKELGWHYKKHSHASRYSPAIVSRFDIEVVENETDKSMSVKLKDDENDRNYSLGIMHPKSSQFNAWDIAYNKSYTVENWNGIHNDELNYKLASLNKVEENLFKPQNPKTIDLIVGDFNTVMNSDFGDNSIESNVKTYAGLKLAMSSKLIDDMHFKDSYRVVHPSVKKAPGYTGSWWFQRDKLAWGRIDHIMYRNNKELDYKLKPVKSYVTHYHPVTWVSDHSAVVTKFKVIKKK